MANLNIAVLGSPGYAKNLGKCGTATDITLYDMKRGEDTITLIEPSRYPERLAPLFYAVSMADEALLIVDEINAEFGEMIVMLDVAGIRKGYILLRNFIDPGQIAPLLKGTVVEFYEPLEDDAIRLRELLMNDVSALSRESTSESPGIVVVDHHFNVKGIGTVILGSVAAGIVRRHDTLTVFPNEKKGVVVRSIQKHDDDFEVAGPGDRVGLALKNVEADELDRGDVLSAGNALKTSDTITAELRPTRFWQVPIKEDMVVHIGHWMQFVSGRIVSVSDDGDHSNPTLTVCLDSPLVYLPGDRAVLHHLDAGKLRVVGSLTLA